MTYAGMLMRLAMPALVASSLLAAGCGGKTSDEWFKEKMTPPSTAERVAQIESDSADVRREALVKVAADSQACRTPSVAKLFCLVAKTDADAMVRSTAVRGLALMEGPEVLATLSQVATADKNPFVRADAVNALARRVPPEGAPALIQALASDSSDDVRLAAAVALRQFREKAAAEALVPMVEYTNIGVAMKAWESLRHMTGQDLPRENQAWAEFLASAADPFAAYGKAPPMPPGPNQRPKFTKGIGDFFKGIFETDVREKELQ